jgi:hypothetical protein
MRAINLEIGSRLRATPLIQERDSNIYYFGMWGRVEFPARNDDRIKSLTVRDIINWPGLSNDYFNTPNMAWVIWVANGITDPWAVAPGTRVRIPGKDHVDEVVAAIFKDAE